MNDKPSHLRPVPAGAITKVDAPSDTLPDDDVLQAVIHGLRTS